MFYFKDYGQFQYVLEKVCIFFILEMIVYGFLFDLNFSLLIIKGVYLVFFLLFIINVFMWVERVQCLCGMFRGEGERISLRN